MTNIYHESKISLRRGAELDQNTVSLSLTSGVIIGQLAGFSSISDGYIAYSFNECTAIFYRHNNEYRLFNKSADERKTLAISFPAIGKLYPQTRVIPGMWEYNLNALFNSNSSGDNSRFFLTSCVSSLESGMDAYIFVYNIVLENPDIIILNGIACGDFYHQNNTSQHFESICNSENIIALQQEFTGLYNNLK